MRLRRDPCGKPRGFPDLSKNFRGYAAAEGLMVMFGKPEAFRKDCGQAEQTLRFAGVLRVVSCDFVDHLFSSCKTTIHEITRNNTNSSAFW
jgi:hypothetical protein